MKQVGRKTYKPRKVNLAQMGFMNETLNDITRSMSLYQSNLDGWVYHPVTSEPLLLIEYKRFYARSDIDRVKKRLHALASYGRSTAIPAVIIYHDIGITAHTAAVAVECVNPAAEAIFDTPVATWYDLMKTIHTKLLHTDTWYIQEIQAGMQAMLNEKVASIPVIRKCIDLYTDLSGEQARW
jgi:hypothetical protein